MIDRDALCAFQSRLGDRFEAARTPDMAVVWLAVEVGHSKYLFSLNHAGEIFPWIAPQPVPCTVPWFLGVVHWRGGLHGVVELSAFLADHGALVMDATNSTRIPSYLVMLNEVLATHCTLGVDRLMGLRGIDAFVASQAPAADMSSWLGPLYTDASGASWREINLQALSRHPRFLNIAASFAAASPTHAQRMDREFHD